MGIDVQQNSPASDGEVHGRHLKHRGYSTYQPSGESCVGNVTIFWYRFTNVI